MGIVGGRDSSDVDTFNILTFLSGRTSTSPSCFLVEFVNETCATTFCLPSKTAPGVAGIAVSASALTSSNATVN